MNRWLGLIVALMISAPASAQQLKYDIDKGGGQWAFTAVWKGADGQRQRAQFSLPADVIKQDLAEPLYWDPAKIAKVAARDINDHDFGRGADCDAEIRNGTLWTSCTGKTQEKRQAASDQSQALIDARKAKWLDRHGFKVYDDGMISIDWAQHVLDYSDDLAPVVAGLGGPTPDRRVFAEKALGLVQTIPYEERGKKPDKYRRPLSILGRNRGDCDSKTVLFLALMHQAYPDLGMGVVVIKNHAYGALALDAQAGDTLVRVNDDSWVAVEPVGGPFAVGDIGRKSGKALRRRRYQVIRAT
jgi:hypothetical protein